MDTNEKFKIWDATEPQVSEVRAYLDRICGKTPAQLVYKNEDGTFSYTDTVCKERPLIGVLYYGTVFYLRAFCNQDLYDETDGNFSCEKSVHVGNVNDWISKNDFFAPEAHIVYESDYRRISGHGEEFWTTLEILEYHQLLMPGFKRSFYWFSEAPEDGRIYDDEWQGYMSNHLKSGGVFWICSPKPKKTISHIPGTGF